MTAAWTMPRDLSKMSTLEAEMLFAIHALGLPQPEAEYRFMPCKNKDCGHGDWPAHIIPDADIGTPFCLDCIGENYHRFQPTRRWRFDFAWPDRKVAVECEGGGFVGGRHNTGAGMEADMEKYSTAEAMGWHVLRFSQRQIHSGLALELVERALVQEQPK